MDTSCKNKSPEISMDTTTLQNPNINTAPSPTATHTESHNFSFQISHEKWRNV